MAEQTLRLLMVHAHPDDEAVATGGTLAHYAARGARTVLVADGTQLVWHTGIYRRWHDAG